MMLLFATVYTFVFTEINPPYLLKPAIFIHTFTELSHFEYNSVRHNIYHYTNELNPSHRKYRNVSQTNIRHNIKVIILPSHFIQNG